MARSNRRLDASDVTPEMMDKARQNAQLKKARMLAEQELGIGDENSMVVRGPAPIKDEEMVTMTLDMYEGAKELRIDGTVYFHGQTITVTKRVADSILDIIDQGWRHQEEIDGKPRNTYKPRLAVISGRNV